MATETENFEIPENWQLENDQLVRKMEFSKYLECVDFANEVAHLAERLNHHPSITIEYSSVQLTLYSHDKGTITKRDIDFASSVNDLLK